MNYEIMKIETEEYYKMKDTIESYYKAIEDIKDILYGINLADEEINVEQEIKGIIESLEREI